jgi:hypothetical protein
MNEVVMKKNMALDFSFHPLTLRFHGDQEKAFLEDHTQKSLHQIRLGLALGLLLYPLFGILDNLMIPDVKEEIWLIRFGIVCPFLLAMLFLTWTRFFKKYAQPLMVMSVLVAGLGVVAMTELAYPPGSYFYYAGLILALMWAYTVVSLRFIYATSAGFAIIIAYEIIAGWFSETPASILISNNFFFLSANFVGMMACYLMEYYQRKDYCQQNWLVAERKKSDGLLEQLHQELLLASEIQKSLQPPPMLSWQGGEVIFYSKPSLEIGGDFYSYQTLSEDRFAMAVGDVSGHGIPAALFMAASLSIFSASMARNMRPCERLALLDEELEAYTDRNHQNCAFCYLELERNQLLVANAGGVPPFVRRTSGEVDFIKAVGFPLGHGLGKEFGYQGVQTGIHGGDMIVLVSDGVVEAVGKDEEMFGFERLKQTISMGPDSAHAMLHHLVGVVDHFTDKNAFQDDFTIAILKVGVRETESADRI